jgi:hypothetical protein
MAGWAGWAGTLLRLVLAGTAASAFSPSSGPSSSASNGLAAHRRLGVVRLLAVGYFAITVRPLDGLCQQAERRAANADAWDARWAEQTGHRLPLGCCSPPDGRRLVGDPLRVPTAA